MDSLAERAQTDPVGVAVIIQEAHDLTIGEAFVTLPHLGNEPIPTVELDVRSRNVLGRMKCETWADLAARTVGDIWNTPAAGRLTVSRILAAAAQRNAQEATEAEPDVTFDHPADGGMSRQRHSNILNQVVRQLASWAIRERGATKLSDFLSLSADLGRIPPEVSASFAHVGELPLEDLLDAAGSELPRGLLRDLLSTTDARRVQVLAARKLRLAERPTLDELGKQLGVGRERVRQLESQAISAAQQALASDAFAPLRWRASDLCSKFGVAVLENSQLFVEALGWAVRGLVSPEQCEAGDVMLWAAGPYERDEGWLLLSGYSLEGLRRDFAQRVAALDIIDEQVAKDVLQGLGVRGHMTREFVTCAPGWRTLEDGRIAKWSGTVADKAEVILRMTARPCSVKEVNALIGEDHAAGTLRNALSADARFVRVDKPGNFALAEWGLEEYSGIVQEIIERIERGSGSADLQQVVSDLVASFGVSATSVRMYVSSPSFIVSEGRVMLRPPDDPYVPDQRIDRVRGLYAGSDGRIVLHDIADKDVLRGSGQNLPEAAAALMGILPGGRATFAFDDESRIVVYWSATSVMGPSLGSLRPVVERLGLVVGEAFRLIFAPQEMTCTVEAVRDESIEGLTGLVVPPGGELQALATALRVEPQEVRSRLQARGDDAVLRHLPAVKIAPDLGEAISRFGDLVGD